MKAERECELRSWLIYPNRLTERLIGVAGEASVQVLHQGVVNQNWLREIIIVANGEPCWYARTMTSQNTYSRYEEFFDQLKTKLLGDLIYNSTMVRRTSLRHYPIGSAAYEFKWLPEFIQQNCHQALWMRSSFFILDEKVPFYLKEIFLPAMQRYFK